MCEQPRSNAVFVTSNLSQGGTPRIGLLNHGGRLLLRTQSIPQPGQPRTRCCGSRRRVGGRLGGCWFGGLSDTSRAAHRVLYKFEEGGLVQDTAFTSHRMFGDGQRAINARPTGPAFRVPATRSYWMPIAIVIVVFARQHETDQRLWLAYLAADDNQRPIFALGVILLEGDPRPHNFARIRIAIAVRCVIGLESATEVDGSAAFWNRNGHGKTVGESSERRHRVVSSLRGNDAAS